MKDVVNAKFVRNGSGLGKSPTNWKRRFVPIVMKKGLIALKNVDAIVPLMTTTTDFTNPF